LIELLATSEEARGVTDLSKELGWAKSNVHQILKTLVQLDIAEKSRDGNLYSLTLKIWEIGMLVQARLSPQKVATAQMRELAEFTGETVHLAIFDKDHVVYIDHIESVQPVRSYSRIGGSGPAHCTAIGKALLAFQPPETIEVVLGKLQAFTETTITCPETIRAALETIRSKGYAIQREEWRTGVSGIGAPIFDSSRSAVAGLGISGPADRLSSEKCAELGPRVAAFAQKISQQLGFTMESARG